MKHKFKVGQRVKTTASSDGGVPYWDANKVFKITEDLKDNTYMLSNGYCYRDDQIIKCTGTATLRTSTKGFRFNLVAANGEKVATSEVYTTKAMALKTIRKYFPDFEVIDKTKKNGK